MDEVNLEEETSQERTGPLSTSLWFAHSERNWDTSTPADPEEEGQASQPDLPVVRSLVNIQDSWPQLESEGGAHMYVWMYVCMYVCV